MVGSARMTRADCGEACGSPPECFLKMRLQAPHNGQQSTYNNPGAQRISGIHIGNASMDVHGNRGTVFDENLLEKHAGHLAGLNEGVRHKISLRSVWAGPAKAQSFFFRCSGIYENIPLPWNLLLDTTTEGLGLRRSMTGA